MLKRLFIYLPFFISATALLFLLEFLTLNLCRITFYFFFFFSSLSDVSSRTILWAFRMGLEFDMMICTYALFLPAVLLFINEFVYVKTKVVYYTALSLTLIIFWIYALVSAADMPFFKQFGNHLNRQAFLWAESPGFVLRLIFGNISYYGYLIFFLVVAFLKFRTIRWIFKLAGERLEPGKRALARNIISFVLLVPFMIAGARGRLSPKSTSHEGLAIMGDNLFVNQIALNPNFTLFRSLFFQKVKNYSVPADIDKSIAFARNYFGIRGVYERSITRRQKADSAFVPYNVVIVCMESMSRYKMGIHNRPDLTPRFNELIRQSVLFDNFFSSGIHTFNGLFSTCAAYPSMLTEQGLRRYTKKPFTTLGNLLLKKNYRTYLALTHDPVFDNMEGFFKLNGYSNTISSYDFSSSRAISATGVPDHELFDLFIERMNSGETAKPFLGFIMTGSDHGPWAVPDDIPFKPTAETQEMRSTQYADWAIGEFMRKARMQKWYKNTLFVFLGDHGYAVDGTYDMPLSYHNIPLVLHMPKKLRADTIHSVGYQPDVTETVAGILNLEFENNTFGINLLKEKHPFVFFTADDKVGCVDNDGFYFYELHAQNVIKLRKYRDLDQHDYYKEYMSRADSLRAGGKKMLDAAEFFIRQNYFSY